MKNKKPARSGRIASFCVLLFASLCCLPATSVVQAGEDALEQGFQNPPREARLRAYWWWLNGCVTEAAITRDLEEMKAKGFGGALICDAGGAEQDGNDRVPHGPTFLTPEWRKLYRHTLKEANRLGLEMSLNIQSGWNLGGPMVKADDAAKKLVWSETRVTGPASFHQVLPMPKHRDNYFRDLFVLAHPAKSMTLQRMQNWEQKAMHKALSFSAPDTTPLLVDAAAKEGEEATLARDVVDISAKLDKQGVLHWEVPAGNWDILRIGCTIGDHSYVSTSSDEWKGFALDVLDAGAFTRYWDAVVEPLIQDAGKLAGSTLKYLHTDSWEVEAINWTPTLREEFRRRRGYDFLPYLPVFAGRIVDSRPVSNRFLHDFRKTLGDLAIDNHYRLFRERAHQHGLLIHPESGGPHAVPVDAQRCLGYNDVPMSEFWAWSWRHRVGDSNRFFVKQPASAAHVYGRKIVAAEGFTTIGPHWQETIWDNLKPSFDQAACEGFNLLVWHAFVCSPEAMGLPGIQYFAGTHFNPNSTWWPYSAPFLSYINRNQFLLQQGLFVADACYYYGDHVPNFGQLKRSDPARILPGYDYDVITEEAILERTSVRNGRLFLPDGMSYRVLVLPTRSAISLPVLRKVQELLAQGITVIGPKPEQATGLHNFPDCDDALKKIAQELWGEASPSGQRTVGKGRLIWGKAARVVLSEDGVMPDFAYQGADAFTALDYIHRRDGQAEMYFVSNRSNRWETAVCTFRVSGKAPELWDAVTGERRFASAYELQQDTTKVPLQLPPFGSLWVVFREPAAKHPANGTSNFISRESVMTLQGPWNVAFDPRWGGPESVTFDVLSNWATHSDAGVRYYSGTAKYRKTFNFEAKIPSGERILLDLGQVRELARIQLNGSDLGIVWTPPFSVDIRKSIKTGENLLEIEVVNFWPNRIIGDQIQGLKKPFTKTNIRKLTKDSALMPSGLLGPVNLKREKP